MVLEHECLDVGKHLVLVYLVVVVYIHLLERLDEGLVWHVGTP